LGSIVSQ